MAISDSPAVVVIVHAPGAEIEPPPDRKVARLILGALASLTHMRGFRDGFLVQRSNGNTFTGNRMSDVREGSILHISDRNRLVDNHATNVQEFGFAWISGPDRNRVLRNTAADFGIDGLAVAEGRRNTIVDNVAKNGRGNGFQAFDLALGNTFSDNTAIDNGQWGSRT